MVYLNGYVNYVPKINTLLRDILQNQSLKFKKEQKEYYIEILHYENPILDRNEPTQNSLFLQLAYGKIEEKKWFIMYNHFFYSDHRDNREYLKKNMLGKNITGFCLVYDFYHIGRPNLFYGGIPLNRSYSLIESYIKKEKIKFLMLITHHRYHNIDSADAPAYFNKTNLENITHLMLIGMLNKVDFDSFRNSSLKHLCYS